MKMEAYFYKCRMAYCDNPAIEGKACCSKKCRDMVPTCIVSGCNNATEPGIYKGSDLWYSKKCYEHGGRIEYDGEPQEKLKRSKLLYRKKLVWTYF